MDTLTGPAGTRTEASTGRLPGSEPKVLVLKGKTWRDVLEADHPTEVQAAIEKEVTKRLDADYKHVDRKTELRTAYQALVMDCFTHAGEDDEDPEFVALVAMRKPLSEIIGLPDLDD